MPVSSSRSTVTDSQEQLTTASPVREVNRLRFQAGKLQKQADHLSIEEPLEIILIDSEQNRTNLAITMRTPGHDRELVAGFLFTEGLVHHAADIIHIEHDEESAQPANTIRVELGSKTGTKIHHLHKHFFTNSACGVCGKTSIQALEMLHRPTLTANKPLVNAEMLCSLPTRLRQHQLQFASTGGVHSAALFMDDGALIALREDVGRHNALDKLIGYLLLSSSLKTENTLLLVSGRASFELVQKALMADIAVLAAIGAPTSLAVELATRHNMTLAGFLKQDSFNIYSGQQRIEPVYAHP